MPGLTSLHALVHAALAEDLGPGDVTSEACVPEGARGEGRIVAKQALVVSGLEVAGAVFAACGGDLWPLVRDGDAVEPGQVVARVGGPLRGVLLAERTALNFLMRLSGIATHTRSVVASAGGAMKVLDTRKTTPLHRALEKAAVRHGGGGNHRCGLFDGVLIKENHIVAAGGLAAAVTACRAHAHHLLRVQLEVETLAQLVEALDLGVDAFLLDNMDDATLAQAVALVRGSGKRGVVLEASGNMTAERIARLAGLGLTQVSVGGLVHQARWVDLSLRLDATSA